MGTNKTQGEAKMIRYVSELIRKDNFIKLLRRLKKGEKNVDRAEEAERFNNEYAIAFEAYKSLKKSSKFLNRGNYSKYAEIIADRYGLDNDLIQYALALWKMNTSHLNLLGGLIDEPDMCRIELIHDDSLSPTNPGQEIIYLDPTRKLRYIAFPVAVAIHQRASKRDVLDFIEKKWRLIESLRTTDEKTLKFRKRKHSQDFLDFLWENRSYPTKYIKRQIDLKFPSNGLAYFEISKILSEERKRRLT